MEIIFYIFGGFICSIWAITRFFLWLAAGFIKPRLFPMIVTGFVIVIYGVDSIIKNTTDGFVAIFITLFTALVIIFNRRVDLRHGRFPSFGDDQ
jgi:hypothetical protein